MKLSVVIPIYNVYKYLSQCINSVIAQNYKELEIILVDDGSTDGSGKLCDEFKEKYNNIIVIHKDNGGLSDARNTGIKVCTGEYIMFLDSDDYWEGEFITHIMGMIQNNPKVDMITSDGIVELLPGGVRKPSICDFNRNSFVHEDGEKFLEYILPYKSKKGTLWVWTAWRNVYRTSLLKDNNLFFKKGILLEDAEWTPKVILSAKYFDYYDQPFYIYRKYRTNSILNTCSFKKVKDYISTVNGWISYAEKLKNQHLAFVIKERFSNDLFPYMKYVYSFDEETKQKAIKLFEESLFINYVTDPRYDKMVKKIKYKGYREVMERMHKEYAKLLLLKRIAISMRLVDR